MTRTPVVVAVDQGTSATKALVVGASGEVLARSSVRIGRSDPLPGWVEQDACEIAGSATAAVGRALEQLDDRVEVVALGLSAQRESAVVWDRRTGEPLGPVLGWQDRRTAPRVAPLVADGSADLVRERTGLPLDPVFSALKLGWLLDACDPDRERSRCGEVAVGTVDSWLLHGLTGEHRIEAGSASRTQLLGLRTLAWDEELLELFGVPRACLPEVVASDAPSAAVRGVPGLERLGGPGGVRVHGVLGDSHAALYAHGVRAPGRAKVTCGSGSSLMGLVEGPGRPGSPARGGLVRTLAWSTPETGGPSYAAEGTALSTGATLLWLAQVLDTDPAHLSELAQSVESSDGVDLVPAFAGLGAPHWDERATALVSGFGLGTRAGHLARAAFESVALQTEDLLAALDDDLGVPVTTVLVDGGPTRNDWLVQLQADLSQREVVRSDVPELSALGAAHLAGVSAGLWTPGECGGLPRSQTTFTPRLDDGAAAQRRAQWREAVARARHRPTHPAASPPVPAVPAIPVP